MTALPIYELRRGQCRYSVSPSNAREFLFCAEPVEYEGCPYCPEHAARCFDRRATQEKREEAKHASRLFDRIGRSARAARPSSPPKF